MYRSVLLTERLGEGSREYCLLYLGMECAVLLSFNIRGLEKKTKQKNENQVGRSNDLYLKKELKLKNKVRMQKLNNSVMMFV